MNIVSSSLWIVYSFSIADTPLLVRGACDLILFTISSLYIMHNRAKELQVLVSIGAKTRTTTVVPGRQ
jgi:hypothetical protein